MSRIAADDPAIAAFSRQSTYFDAIDAANPLIAHVRHRVRTVVSSFIRPGMRMLELNAGTGLDSAWFAERGVAVTATEIAPGMLTELRKKQRDGLEVRACSFTDLASLGEGTFDAVFSNFGGLNCTDRLQQVLHDAEELLRPGGVMALVIMPKTCLWELAWFFRGRWRSAFRRWRRNGAPAHIDGVRFPCYYYSPSQVQRWSPGSSRLHLEGLSIVFPPPHATRFATRWPGLTRQLGRLERMIAQRWPYRSIGDHYLLILRKAE